MPDQPVLLSYPDPPLTDGAVVLRRWAESDIGCVEEASRDPHIPEGTTVPASFTVADGLARLERGARSGSPDVPAATGHSRDRLLAGRARPRPPPSLACSRAPRSLGADG